jgi:hypothetical protein
MSKVDRGDIEEATVKVEMDLVEPRAGPKGEYRSIVQIQITAMNEEACVRVTKAIEGAVRTICGDDEQPAGRRH